MNSEIKSAPFSWNDNFSEEALEDFQQIQKDLPYGVCQSIGLALAKLELLEKQDCKVDESRWISCNERQPKENGNYLAFYRTSNDEILNEAWRLLMNVTEGDGVTTAEANGMLKLMNFFFYKYHGLKKKPEWAENVEARLADPTPEEYKMHPIKDGFPKTNSVRYLVQDTDGRIWDAEYDECQDNPAERFGEWAQRFDPQTLGAIDSEWDPYPDIVAWCERPELYEEDDQEH